MAVFELCVWLLSLIPPCPELCPRTALSALSLQASVSFLIHNVLGIQAWLLCLGEPCFRALVSWCDVCQGPRGCPSDPRCLLPCVLLGRRCPRHPFNGFTSLLPSCGARHCRNGTNFSVSESPCTTGATSTSTLQVICQSFCGPELQDVCHEQRDREAQGPACEQQRISPFRGSFPVLLHLGAVHRIIES